MGIEVVSPLDCPTLAAPFFNLLVVERISHPIIISTERHVTTPVPLYRASGGGTARAWLYSNAYSNADDFQ